MANLRFDYRNVRDVEAGPSLQLPRIISAQEHGDLTPNDPFGSFLKGALDTYSKEKSADRATQRQVEGQSELEKRKSDIDIAGYQKQKELGVGPEFERQKKIEMDQKILDLKVQEAANKARRGGGGGGGGMEGVGGAPNLSKDDLKRLKAEVSESDKLLTLLTKQSANATSDAVSSGINERMSQIVAKRERAAALLAGATEADANRAAFEATHVPDPEDNTKVINIYTERRRIKPGEAKAAEPPVEPGKPGVTRDVAGKAVDALRSFAGMFQRERGEAPAPAPDNRAAAEKAGALLGGAATRTAEMAGAAAKAGVGAAKVAAETAGKVGDVAPDVVQEFFRGVFNPTGRPIPVTPPNPLPVLPTGDPNPWIQQYGR